MNVQNMLDSETLKNLYLLTQTMNFDINKKGDLKTAFATCGVHLSNGWKPNPL